MREEKKVCQNSPPGKPIVWQFVYHPSDKMIYLFRSADVKALTWYEARQKAGIKLRCPPEHAIIVNTIPYQDGYDYGRP